MSRDEFRQLGAWQELWYLLVSPVGRSWFDVLLLIILTVILVSC